MHDSQFSLEIGTGIDPSYGVPGTGAHGDRLWSSNQEMLSGLLWKLRPFIKDGVTSALYRRRWQSGGRNVQQECEDFIQETFVSLLKDEGRVLRSWDPDQGLSLENYVRMIANRQVRTIFRTNRRNPWHEDPTPGPDLEIATKTTHISHSSVEGRLASKEMLKQLCNRLETQLSPLGRQLFTRLFLNESSVGEICDELNMSPDAVYAWKSRLSRLARFLFSYRDPENLGHELEVN